MAAHEQDALQTIHATAIVVGRAGILVRGESGAGKTTLAKALVAFGETHLGHGRFVADDRVYVTKQNRAVIARCPAPIAGFAEHHHVGIVPVRALPAACLDCVVVLQPQGQLDRLPDRPLIDSHHGLPMVSAPIRQIEVSVPLILAFLDTLSQTDGEKRVASFRRPAKMFNLQGSASAQAEKPDRL